MSQLLDGLDHPVMFVFLLSLAVCGMTALMTWGAKAAGWSGAAAVLQHP